MNPLTASDGSSRCIIVEGKFVDDGNFFTQNKPTLDHRAFRITNGAGLWVMGCNDTRPVGWRVRKEPHPTWVLTRAQLQALDLRNLPVGVYTARVWGVNNDDPEWYEVGSEDSAHAGIDVSIATAFVIGTPPPPPPPPGNELQELIGVLRATQEVNRRSKPFLAHWAAAVSVDNYLTDAIARAQRLKV